MIATKFKSNVSRLVALTIVEEKDEIMIVTASGVVSRIKAVDISCQGRPATGVKAQNLGENDTVVSCNKIVNTDSENSSESSDVATTTPAEDEGTSQGTLL